MVIWKYEIPINDKFIVHLPSEAKILTVQKQGSNACLWALVDPKAKNIERKFAVVGTGVHFPYEKFNYISTFQLFGGELIFHVFEILE